MSDERADAARPDLDRRRLVGAVIDSYDDPVARAYCHARFRIINQRFLDEMRQYLPVRGDVLEIGCGFGLFGLYFGLTCPGLSITGIDVDRRRIEMARRAADRLQVGNARFEEGDARTLRLDRALDAVYMLDIIHHIGPDAVPGLLRQLHDQLRPGGILLIKDVDTRPLPQMLFTWTLDVLMSRTLPHYWRSERLIALLREIGFQVFCHPMLDLLPYPHRLFFCVKGGLGHLTGA